MGLLEFNKLPIITLVGADWKTFKAITAGREIDAAYKGKYRRLYADCFLHWPHCRTNVMRSCWRINRWSMIRCLFWGTGGAELLLCTMYSPVISILAIIRPIRPCFLI